MSLEELYIKHNVLTDGLQRRYFINVKERRFDLDYVTPIELVILVPKKWEIDEGDIMSSPKVVNKKFESRSWVQLLKDLVTYLLEKSPKEKETLYEYRTDWSKAPIFSNYKSIDNMVKIEEDLYFSVNYTATHSAWIIGDLLKYFNINLGYLVLHRTPISEPQEIREEIGRVRRLEFKEFLISQKNKNEDRADKIVKNIDVLSKILVKMGTSYNDFFLFDDTIMLSNFKAKLLKDINKYVSWDDTKINTAKRYLDYLTDYFTSVFKKTKNNKDNLELFIPVL